MSEPTISVERVVPSNHLGTTVYRITTVRRRLGTNEPIHNYMTITEAEAIVLVNRICHAMVGGDDG